MKNLILLLSLISVLSCKDNKLGAPKDVDYIDVLTTELHKAQYNELLTASEWLKLKINQFENDKDMSITKIHIYRGEWGKSVVYLIRNNLSSCILCEVYYDYREKIDLSSYGVLSDFSLTTKNWQLVYEYGNGFFLK
jgi:hypothetical protein